MISLEVSQEEPGPERSRRSPLQTSSQWTMKDGTKVEIRPIRPQDEPLMVKFHAVLSDRTVYLRYFCSLSLATRAAHERLVRICFSDPETETVLVATRRNPQNGEESILAVGRLNRLPGKNEAEVAILVTDEFQGRGLGGELLRLLIQAGREEKLDRIVGEMLRDNIAMQVMIKKHGFRLRLLDDPQYVRAVLEL